MVDQKNDELPIQEEFVMAEEFTPANSQEQYEYDAEHPGSKDMPFSEEALRNAQLGQYENTMFKMWDEFLQGAIRQASDPLTIPFADQVLRQWPWFKYYDIPVYLTYRQQFLQEALDVLRGCYPRPMEELNLENVDDWKRHKDEYLNVVVEWTRLSNRWASKWYDTPLNKPAKAILHGVVSDVTALLINPKNGLVENLRNLADFHVSDDEGRILAMRGMMESDDE